MKIRILDRILVAIAGLIILALCAGMVAQVFFGVDVTGKGLEVISRDSQWIRIILGAAAALLLIIGLYCVMVLFRHRSRRDKFIMQKMESGDLSISMKALETMVTKCLDQYDEIEAQNVRLENQRDGLVIRIRGTVASGISIPLTVDTLQKQIKQYVVACSGVEVKGIRVQIESSGEEAKNAPFAIDAPAATPLLHSAERKQEPAETREESVSGFEDEAALSETEEKPEPVTGARSAADAAMEAAENLKKEYEENVEDDRPIHQRLFSTPEEPCIMPLPPEDLNASESESSEKAELSREAEEPAVQTADEADEDHEEKDNEESTL